MYRFPAFAMESFRKTENINIGSAVISILASGGPIAQAGENPNTVQFLSMIDDENWILDLVLEDL